MTGAVEPLDRILDALAAATGRNARRVGKEWVTLCPAHEDSSPSLNVTTGRDGRVVMTCRAGCDLADVLAAAKLDMADLFPPRDEQRSRPEVVARYAYRDEQGELLYTVERLEPGFDGKRKSFRQVPASGQRGAGAMKGVRLVPYRLPELLAAIEAGHPVTYVEGEKDADRLDALGWPATTTPMGAGKWRGEYARYFAGATVRVVEDNDDPGRAHAREVAASLAAASADVTCWRPATGKDVSDHLNAGRELRDLVQVDSATPSAVGTDGTVGTDLLAGLRDGAWLDGQQFPPLRYAVPGLLPEGFTLLVGPPKAGKSWFALGILLAVSSGGYAVGKIRMPAPRRVLYLALEDGDRRMQDRCRTLLNGTPIPALFHYLTKIQPGTVLPTIEAFLKRYPDTVLVVVDTLGKVMPSAQMGESSYQRDYRVGSGLKALADERPGLAIKVLHHDRKAGAEDFVDSVSATHGLAGSADTVIVLGRRRNETVGLLKVTGRDVPEGEYALTLAEDATWSLDGDTLAAAAVRAVEREQDEGLGNRAADILAFIRQHPQADSDGVATSEVTAKFGDMRVYLTRLVESGRIVRVSRGRYGVPTVPLFQPPAGEAR